MSIPAESEDGPKDQEGQQQQPGAGQHDAPPSPGGGPLDGDARVRRVIPPELPLGWTQMGPEAVEPSPADRVRYPWDVVENAGGHGGGGEGNNAHLAFPPPGGELVVVGTAGQKITRMGGRELVARCGAGLTRLVLRSHLLRRMDGGMGGFEKLELLELYDNQIEALEGLDDGDGDGGGGKPGTTLRVLDMSYNVIRDMGPVRLCPNLEELYLANNKLKVIAGLGQLKQLRKIDLGANRIRTIPEEELAGLENLEELWLGKNKIENIGGLDRLTKLRRLDVQANRLTRVENLTAQVDTLEELYLAHNGIDDEGASCETGLALHFTALNTIDLSRNRLKSTKPFAHLLALEELWLSGNSIQTFDDVESLSALGTRDGACLEGIYLEMNPVAGDFEYRKKLAQMIPSLKQIDANAIGGNHAIGGVPTARMQGMVDRMRELQDAALRRASEQAEAGQEAAQPEPADAEG